MRNIVVIAAKSPSQHDIDHTGPKWRASARFIILLRHRSQALPIIAFVKDWKCIGHGMTHLVGGGGSCLNQIMSSYYLSAGAVFSESGRGNEDERIRSKKGLEREKKKKKANVGDTYIRTTHARRGWRTTEKAMLRVRV